MKKFSKKLELSKREINDLTTEEQTILEGGTAYTCGTACQSTNPNNNPPQYQTTGFTMCYCVRPTFMDYPSFGC